MKYDSFPWFPAVAARDVRGLHERCLLAQVVGFIPRRRFPIKIRFYYDSYDSKGQGQMLKRAGMSTIVWFSPCAPVCDIFLIPFV